MPRYIEYLLLQPSTKYENPLKKKNSLENFKIISKLVEKFEPNNLILENTKNCTKYKIYQS